MIGTTRSRVSFFMNRFREMGFIQFNGTLEVERHPARLVLVKPG
jgi:CRP/FNR family transcriptional regulator, cyclic AMP receptor protein